MRLKSIKLAGFKSFVDPTHFDLPGQLIGVVGPNGCGKSNIIDAVRWVLGESRASELRGESMQDVIFNGSGLRKPSGRASVELVFDNTDGRALGQWSAFGEISVKRVLTRDGASNYLINQQSVRRKDIQDMFLGTGLGPRAYAIIGQGMISRIIEAKPEELRIFLEEAAGVSKYKERRKETESRLESTQENLTRVRDILRELDAQLIKLESQAQVAGLFQEYQSSMQSKQHLLWFMRMTQGETERQRHNERIRTEQVLLEERIALLRSSELSLENTRADQYVLQDEVSQAQAALYEVTAAVAQTESEIRFANESKLRLQAQITDLITQKNRWQGQLDQATEQFAAVCAQLEQSSADDSQCQAHLSAHESILPELEVLWKNSQQTVETTRSACSEIEKELARIQSLAQSLSSQAEQTEQRLVRLKIDFEQLIRPDSQALLTAQDRLQSALKKRDDAQSKRLLSEQQILQADQARAKDQEQFQITHQAVQQTQAKLSALKNIQEQVLAQGKLMPWLQKNDLATLPRLWQKIHVESGWERAVESVLRERIGAIEAQSLAAIIQYEEQTPPSRVAWFLANAQPAANKDVVAASLTPLLSRIQVRDLALSGALSDWLALVYVTESVQEGVARREELPTSGLFVTTKGHLISRVGVQLYAEDNEQAGLIIRAKELEGLEKQLKSEQFLLDEAQSHLSQAQGNYQQAHHQSVSDRQAVEQSVKDAHRFEVEAMQLLQAEEQYSVRAAQVQQELAETAVLRDQIQTRIFDNVVNTESQTAQLSLSQASFDEAVLAHEVHSQSRSVAIQKRQELQSIAQEASFEVRSLRQRQTDLERDMRSATEQLEALNQTQQTAQAELEQLTDLRAQELLQELLESRSGKENALADVRTRFDALMFDLKELDEKRLGYEKEIEPIREKITAAQLKEQAARLSVEQFETLLKDNHADFNELQTAVTDDVQLPNLQHQVNDLQTKITALGPVNMAALDELKTSSERKSFLDAQSADLNEAIQTLTDAIMKIDGETRDLLQATFDQVNQHFSENFPALFGGGTARLVMTGEEILDSGVQVMAQPPGKKNTTIHLLSGGEKALTAIALVFSLFHLNPAPFCLLDEVDAPLDDANTARYADIVAKMSQKTQFLFISHNKITMEIANQLIGVTMQEQGVSRVVAVDIQAATALTQSK